MDYSIFFRSEVTQEFFTDLAGSWDLYLSAYNPSDRVRRPFDLASNAKRRRWLILPEYSLEMEDIPEGGFVCEGDCLGEGDYINRFIEDEFEIGFPERICVDITGFIKPYLVFLLKRFRDMGVKRVDAIFSEPIKYAAEENTRFSDGPVTEVRQVAGCEGIHEAGTSEDHLLVGVGYDDRLIQTVAGAKRHAKKTQMFGLPSLSADMYQQNVLSANKVGDEMGGGLAESPNIIHAPANDPFLVAQKISEWYHKVRERCAEPNFYLSPLSTKPQCLGFILFYLFEGEGEAISIIYPFSERHAASTGEGIARMWRYQIEF